MGAFEDVDRLGYASADLGGRILPLYNNYEDYYNNPGNPLFGKVHSNSLISKLNWQFAPQWNLMLKGSYEATSITKIEEFHNYRKSYSYIGSIEYFPVRQQDFRVFLAYIGRTYNFNEASAMPDYRTHRIELGFMYRIKAY